MKKGRKQRAYETSWGEVIAGLYRRPGTTRYRVVATGQEFREADEHTAVTKFRQLTADLTHAIVLPSVTGKQFGEQVGEHVDGLQRAYVREAGTREGMPVVLESDALFAWIRDALLERPQWLASRVGIPQLAALQDLPLPGRSPSLASLLTSYEKHSPDGKSATKAKLRAFKEFMSLTGAVTLRDCTTAVVIAYRDATRKLHTPEICAKRWQRVRTVAKFGMSEGVDPAEIRGFLDRSETLKSKGKRKRTERTPNPMAVDVYRKLLTSANAEMRALLLLSLNCAMYIGEALALKWSDINDQTKFLVTVRPKNGVRRTATLWPETLDALSKMQRRGDSPYVFTSTHGTQYNRNSFGGKFARLCAAVYGEKHGIEHNQIRDAAYTTAASTPGVPFMAAQLMAGHTLPGESDHYIARQPELVRPACDAVHAVYGPMPASVGGAVKIGRPRKVKAA